MDDGQPELAGKEASMAAPSAGALLTAQVPEPSVDLAALVEFLADSLSLNGSAGPDAWPLLNWTPGDQVLGINTFGVLWRLRRPDQPRKVLSQTFITNAPVPRSSQRSHLGGRLTPNSEPRLRAAVGKLVRTIDNEIERVGQAGADIRALAAGDARALLNQIADQLGISDQDRLQGPTRLAPVRLTEVAHTQDGRRDDVARYLAAIERVDGTREAHIENFLGSLTTLLKKAQYPEITIRAAIAQHRQLATETGKQLNRFFEFLDNEALSRVRLQIASRMMEAIASEAAKRDGEHPNGDLQLLVAYARRASGLLDSIAAEGLPLNLSSEYGKQADFDLRDHTTTAGFVRCLPVWPVWMTQMFEEHITRATGEDGRVIRELTYRFRVNGDVPESPGDSAYTYRLRRIAGPWLQLSGQMQDAQRVARSLAELVFLWAVVPAGEQTPASGEHAFGAATELGGRLEQDGRPALVAALADLRARAAIVDRVSDGLKLLMRTEGTVLAPISLGRTWTYYVNVLRGIVDMQRVANTEHTLVCSTAPRQEQIDFLEHLRVTADHAIRDALLSIQVRVELSEYSLHISGNRDVVSLSRKRPDRLAQVVWRPYMVDDRADPPRWEPALIRKDLPWLVPGRVEVQYSPKSLRWPPNKAKDPQGLQLLAATRAALAVLVYTTLWRLLQRGTPEGESRPAVSVLRLQQLGREADAFSGEESIYAAAQAIEMLLGRDADLRMQGIVLDNQPSSRFKEQGAYAALWAGFPLRIAQPAGDRPTIGVISFAARPANDHPDLPDLAGQMLVLARTYLATPTESPYRGYEMRCVATRTEIIEPDESLPPSIDAEIARLYEDNACRHIILLQHRFGQRRVGGHAAHSRLRHQDRLLAELAPRFPDAVMYPLVRDTFAATRLRSRRISTEDAFEILRPDEHVMLDDTEEGRILRRNYTPIYSLATLHVVGGTGAESDKPQSGFCTYFLLRDNLAPVEVLTRLESNLLLSTSSVRQSLISVLRSIHYLEAERAIGPKSVQPVLDPYDWMAPTNTGKVGEVTVFESTRSAHGSVSLSLTALLHLVSRVLHGLPTELEA
jgi:hypothetical protein